MPSKDAPLERSAYAYASARRAREANLVPGADLRIFVAPRRLQRERKLAAANIRYCLSATTWHYYRFYFGFSLKDSIECARIAIPGKTPTRSEKPRPRCDIGGAGMLHTYRGHVNATFDTSPRTRWQPPRP